MKKALYIGHSFHLKTKSNLFFVELLRQKYEIDLISYDPYTETYESDDTVIKEEYDLVVLWQVIPPRNFLNDRFKFKKGLFVPMFDSLGDSIPWDFYRDFKILCFSKTVYTMLLLRGFDAYYIQYFIEPFEQFEFGNEKSVFLWQRRENINVNTTLTLLRNQNIEKIHIHKALDPNERFVMPSSDKHVNLEFSEWFKDPNEMRQLMRDSAFYIAPRFAEGIGLSFLEAMAMGRCVIGNNYPTMSEYIVDDYNGYLFDINNPKEIVINDVKRIQSNTYAFAKEGYYRWNKKKHEILDWIECENQWPSSVLDQELLTMFGPINTPERNQITVTDGLQKRIHKFKCYFELMNKWMELINNRCSLDGYFFDKEIREIAIYGCGKIGNRFYESVKGSGVVKAKYFIDKKAKHCDVECISPEDSLPYVDAIIVTNVDIFDEIKELLEKKTTVPVYSIDQVVEYVYCQYFRKVNL